MSEVKEDERYITKLRAQLSSHFSSVSDKAFHSEVFHAVVFCVACAVGGYVGARMSVTATSIVTSILAVGSTVYRAQGRSFSSLIPVHLGPATHTTASPTINHSPDVTTARQTSAPNLSAPPGESFQQIEQNSFLNLSSADKREIGSLLLRRIGIPCIESVLNFISIPENRAWVLQILKRKNLVTTTTQTESSVTMTTTQDEPQGEGLAREQPIYADSISREQTVYFESVEKEQSVDHMSEREQTLYYDQPDVSLIDLSEDTHAYNGSEQSKSEQDAGSLTREDTLYFDSLRDREKTVYFESSESHSATKTCQKH